MSEGRCKFKFWYVCPLNTAVKENGYCVTLCVWFSRFHINGNFTKELLCNLVNVFRDVLLDSMQINWILILLA